MKSLSKEFFASAASGLVSGGLLLFAGNYINQNQEPSPKFQFIRQTVNSREFLDDNNTIPKNINDVYRFITTYHIGNISKVNAQNFSFYLNKIDKNEVVKIKSDSSGIILSSPLSKNSIDENGTLKISYRQFSSGAYHNIKIVSTNTISSYDFMADDGVALEAWDMRLISAQMGGSNVGWLTAILAVIVALAIAFATYFGFLRRKRGRSA